MSKLPINYAILEFSEIKNDIQLCIKHKLEIVGYCENDSEVLCGACVMEHNSHEIYALNDPKVVLIAENKKQGLAEEENRILNVRDS